MVEMSKILDFGWDFILSVLPLRLTRRLVVSPLAAFTAVGDMDINPKINSKYNIKMAFSLENK